MGADLVKEMTKLLGPGRVAADAAAKKVYESDGFTIARGEAGCVVFPETAEHVVDTVRKLRDLGVQLVPRGSGTGLTGGCVAYDGGVVISTARMRKVIKIDLHNRVAHVEAGVRNTQLSDEVAALPDGARFHFAPDPSSQRASTIGGNAATNAGGIHTLKDFVSSNHVLGMQMVTPEGEVVTIGSTDGRHTSAGPDLSGLLCGSEGTLGIITSVWVRLVPKAAHYRTVVATFPSQRAACDTVSDVIAEGFLPAAMEMMDGRMVQLVNDTFKLGIDAAARALLLIEIDGIADLLDADVEDLRNIAQKHGALTVEASGDPSRRQQLWKARKAAFGAIGRISPSYCTQDACVPRSRLGEVLSGIDQIGQRFGLSINNIFHAGDGNIHPIFLYDDHDPADMENALNAAEEVLKFCIDIGGTLTGEHGVGVEKLHLMPYLFDGNTLKQFDEVKAAFDPHERMNAGKLIPSKTVQIDMMAGLGRKVPQ